MKKMLFTAAAFGALIAAPVAAQQAPGAPEAAQPNPGAGASAGGQELATGGGAGAAGGTTVASVDDVRVNQLIVYGEDRCPPSTDDQINVCVKLPEDDRYRIPPPLRDTPSPAGRAWGSRAMELQYVGRTGIGTCTPSGPGGASGCLVQFINQARAERRGGPDVNWNALIEQARQERLGRIDEESEEIERELSEPR